VCVSGTETKVGSTLAVRVIDTYIHIHTTPQRVSRDISDFLRTFYQIYLLAMRNTADVTGGKPIAIQSQSISGVSAVNPLVAFYDIHGKSVEVLFFCSVPDTTGDSRRYLMNIS
jgi:hypothetical protein